VAERESTLTPTAGRSASRAGEAPAAPAPAPPAPTSRSATVEPTCTVAWGRSGAVEKDK
jgi:hypothetical protein